MQNRIELHLHFDGSLSERTLNELVIRKYDVLTIEEKMLFSQGLLHKSISAAKCNSLADYLKKFDLPCRLLQDPVAVEMAFVDLGQELVNQGVKYAEIRFAPQLHSINVNIAEKLAWEDEIVQAAIRGVNKVMMFNNIVINLILCCMRNLPDGQSGFLANARNVQLASKYLNRGVCAIDLAGAEARDATSSFKVFFETAQDLGIPFTIHAGESGDPRWLVESIKSAIEFGATRIGHGVGLIYSEELRDIVRDRNITVECCLKSNIDTKAVTSLATHPIRSLFDDGIKVTLNTDNMTVSNTSLSNEYLLASRMFSADEIAKMQNYAFDAAFMTKIQRKQVKRLWL